MCARFYLLLMCALRLILCGPVPLCASVTLCLSVPLSLCACASTATRCLFLPHLPFQYPFDRTLFDPCCALALTSSWAGTNSLSQYRSHYASNPPSEQYDVAHLMTGIQEGGVAYLGTVCNKPSNVGVSSIRGQWQGATSGSIYVVYNGKAQL